MAGPTNAGGDSLYQVGGSLPGNAPTYVSRQADSEFLRGLRNGDFCYVLNARQMGKSSLRVRTMQQLQKAGVACASIDITAIGTSGITAEQWYAGIIDSIAESLHLYRYFDLESWWMKQGLLSPVQRLGKFIETVLLRLLPQPIVIFVDEIDSVLGLPFNAEDFFTLIRSCYNQRVDKPEYGRITFAILGVATPSDLIKDKKRTPFNIGKAIELQGFSLEEAAPLSKGLENQGRDLMKTMRLILSWTGGQPFLTQKLCNLLLAHRTALLRHEHQAGWIERLVYQHIIRNWEFNDNPEHLRTIQDRLLHNEHTAGRILGIYQQVLRGFKAVTADNSPEQVQLLLSGLIKKHTDGLQVSNRIYREVFNQTWVTQALSSLRPYAEAITAWLASGGRDESRLLRGQALRDALEWVEGKSISDEDSRFIIASQSATIAEKTRTISFARQSEDNPESNRSAPPARELAPPRIGHLKSIVERLNRKEIQSDGSLPVLNIPLEAKTVIYAFLLPAGAAEQEQALKLIARGEASYVPELVRYCRNQLNTQDMRLYIDAALPALRSLKFGDKEAFLRTVADLIKLGTKVSFNHYTLQLFLRGELQPAVGTPVHYRNFDELQDDISLLLSLLSYANNNPEEENLRIYLTNMRSFSPQSNTPPPLKRWPYLRLEHSVQKLAQLSPILRQSVINACLSCIQPGPAWHWQIEFVEALALFLNCRVQAEDSKQFV